MSRMTPALPTPVGSDDSAIVAGLPRYSDLRQFPSRRPEWRRHSGATTRTSQPRFRTWSSMRDRFVDRPSDDSLAPWTKKSVPTGELDGGAPFGGVMAGMVCRAAPPRWVGGRVTGLSGRCAGGFVVAPGRYSRKQSARIGPL